MSWQNTIQPLSQLNIHLGEGCSLSCRLCRSNRHPAGPGGAQARLPGSLAIQAVREALPLGLRAVRLVGSGVLLHPELDALLDRLENLDLGVTIETDGAGLTATSARRLARLPRASVWVALDGPDADSHDAIHDRAGAFDEAARAIHLLAEAGLPAQVVCTVLRGNAVKIPAIIRLVETLGGDSVLFSMLQTVQEAGSGFLDPDLDGDGDFQAGSLPDGDLKIEELIALGWRIERELAKQTHLKLLFDLPPVFRGLHPKSSTGGLGSAHASWHLRCGILSGLSITAGGAYALCGLNQGRPGFLLGQAGADPLELVWTRHPFLQLLRQGMPDRLEGVCRRCTQRNTCMGFCAVENYLQSGSFWSPNWFCETAAQAGLFPAGRLVEDI